MIIIIFLFIEKKKRKNDNRLIYIYKKIHERKEERFIKTKFFLSHGGILSLLIGSFNAIGI